MTFEIITMKVLQKYPSKIPAVMYESNRMKLKILQFKIVKKKMEKGGWRTKELQRDEYDQSTLYTSTEVSLLKTPLYK
jgi:hypothetical protein